MKGFEIGFCTRIRMICNLQLNNVCQRNEISSSNLQWVSYCHGAMIHLCLTPLLERHHTFYYLKCLSICPKNERRKKNDEIKLYSNFVDESSVPFSKVLNFFGSDLSFWYIIGISGGLTYVPNGTFGG